MKTPTCKTMAWLSVAGLVIGSSLTVAAYARTKPKWVFEKIILANNGGEDLPLCQKFMTELKSPENAKVLHDLDAPPRFVLSSPEFEMAKWHDISVADARKNGVGYVFESPFLPKGPDSAFRAEAADFDFDQDGKPETMIRVIHRKQGY